MVKYTYEGSIRDCIIELKGRKRDKAIHITIFVYDFKYHVFIFDNEGFNLSKTFDTPVESVEYVQDYIDTKIEVGKYDYLTLENVSVLGAHQFEIFGNPPYSELKNIIIN